MNKTLDIKQLTLFWKLVTKRPLEQNEYIEIRFVPLKDQPHKTTVFYENFNLFRKQNKDLIIKSNQVFIKTFDQLLNLLSHNDGALCVNSKPCYGVCRRVMDEEGNICGGYDYVKKVDYIYFDIELSTHGDPTEFQNIILDRFIDYFISKLQNSGLSHASITHSGAGRHLYYAIKDTIITEGRKRWFKKFIEEMMNTFNNKLCIIDNIKDFTRVLSIPGTYNIKRGKPVRFIKFDSNINNFKIQSTPRPKIKKETQQKLLTTAPAIEQSLEWQILTKPDVPQGEINNILIFSLKLLLKQKQIDHQAFEHKLNQIGSNVNLDYNKGTENKTWNPNTVINWCHRNKEWCKRNSIYFNK